MNMRFNVGAHQAPGGRLRIGLAVLLTLQALPTAAGLVVPEDAVRESTPIRILLDAVPTAHRATLHYRATDARDYRSISLKRLGERWLADIPAESVLSPGVEYYITIESRSGAIITDPPEYPQYNPYRLAIAGRPVTRLAAAGPLESNEALTIALPAHTDPKNMRLWIDDRDVTQAAKFSKGQAVYLPMEHFSAGEHRLKLTGPDGRPQSAGTFQVRPQAKAVVGPQLAVKAYASIAYGAGAVRSGTTMTNDVYSNLHGDGAVKYGAIELFADNVDINYARRDSSSLSVATGFTAGGRIGAQTLAYGDMPLTNDTPLLMMSTVRRGLHLNLEDTTRSANFFLVAANPVARFSAAPFTETGGNLYGATVRQQWPSDPLTVFSFSATGANIQQQSGVGLVSSQKPMDGFNLGARLQTQQWGGTFDGQLSLSQIDADPTSSPGTRRSNAYSLSLNRPVQNVNVHAKLWGFGENYATVADPTLLGDRSGWEVGAAQNGIFSWGLTGGIVHNNVNVNTSRPVVESVRTTAQVGLNEVLWPTLSLTLSRADQTSHNEPNGFTRTNNVTDSIVFGSTYAWQWWNVALNIGQLRLDDQSSGNIDLTANNYALSAHANPGKIRLGALVSSTETIEPTRKRNSLLMAGDGTIPLGNDRTQLQGQVVLLQGSLDGQFVRIGGNVRLSWTLPRNTGWRKLLGVDAQLTLTGSHGPALDSATGPTPPNETRLLAGFVVGAPIALDWPEMAP